MRRRKIDSVLRRPPSLALRLTLLFGITAAIVFTAFGLILERSIEHHFVAEDTEELQVIIQAVEQALSGAPAGDDGASLRRRFEDILVGHHGASMHIVAQSGTTVYSSPGVDFGSLSRPGTNDSNDKVRKWRTSGHSYRVLTRRLVPTANQAYTVVAGVAIDHHLHFLDSFHQILWFMVGSGIVLMSIMGWVAARRGHAPLRKIITRISRISANELNTRLAPETVPAELADLAISFNGMLSRVEKSFRRLSDFSADIAHELRTPVTNLMTQTQVALSQARTTDEYREVLYSNMEEYERMARMIGDMLFLAKADEGLGVTQFVSMDLANEVQDLFEFYEAWAEESGVSLVLEGTATASGDRLMLRRALSNLLTNAIQHTSSGQTVHVRLAQTGDNDVTVSIENPGETIPPEHIPRLFDRFYRIDPSRQRRSEGTGLGLAIVKSIVDVHGGRIEVTSSQGVTTFRVYLHGPAD